MFPIAAGTPGLWEESEMPGLDKSDVPKRKPRSSDLRGLLISVSRRTIAHRTRLERAVRGFGSVSRLARNQASRPKRDPRARWIRALRGPLARALDPKRARLHKSCSKLSNPGFRFIVVIVFRDKPLLMRALVPINPPCGCPKGDSGRSCRLISVLWNALRTDCAEILRKKVWRYANNHCEAGVAQW